jgi:5-methylcytosine-specific restriction endonuclease McrA
MATNERAANWRGMNWITQHKRLAIYMRDGMACVWCGSGVETGVTLTLDHLRPANGKHKADNRSRNLVTSCATCNMSRGKRSMLRFAETVAEKTGQESAEVLRRIARHRERSLRKYLKDANEQIAERGSTARVLATRRIAHEP